MKRLAMGCIAAALASTSVPAAATYLPVGPQQNVALATVTGGGWSLCYSATMATGLGSSALDELAACGAAGNNVMLAGRMTGSDTLLLLAQAPYADVIFDTGAADNGITHTGNGSEWYYSDNWSWGFAGLGEAVRKFECDTNAGSDRLCLHTLSSGVGGYRIGDNTNLNDSIDFEKLIFVSSVGGVPEPSTWAMMLAGFGIVGFAMRSRKKAILQTA